MGVLTEIGAMRCVVVVLVAWWGAAAGCPSLCSCRGGAGPSAAGSSAAGPSAADPGGAGSSTASEAPAAGEPLRLRCGGPPALISELKEIDFTDVSALVVSLNMSSNAISTLSRDLRLPNLQKLDLSHNQISLIETDAFYNMTALQRLDLSHNQIAALVPELFKGLGALERLLLDHNLLTTLPGDAFRHLVALKQLDISENPLVCECALVWVGGWARGAGVRLLGAPRCAAPPALAGRAVRKLRVFLDLAACSAAGAAPAPLLLRPERDQLVFEGDALTLACAAPFASALHKYSLRWSAPAPDACELNVTATDVLEEGAAEAAVFLANVTAHHAGAWTCLYDDEGRGRHERTVRVTVLTPATRYCPTAETEDNKGLVSWPQALVNRSVAVPCRAGAALATRACRADGAWAEPDTSQCAYISNVTKLLQQFALLDLELVQYSALNATARLAALVRDSTRPPPALADPDDVAFVARAVASYMRYVHDEPELGSALLDVISAVTGAPAAVMAAAELQHGACSRLVRAAELLAAGTHDKQKSNLAVESFPVGAGFGGATCAWYSAGAGEPGAAPPRLHCTTTNRTVARLLTFSDALIHASVQIPGSVQFSVVGPAARLTVAVFADAALFPLLPREEPAAPHRAKDYYGRSTHRSDTNMEITSPVVSVQLQNGSMSGDLLEPLIATLRAAGCGAGARCAVWDPASKRWQHNSTECAVLHVSGCTWVVSLRRPGALALLARAERGFYGARTQGARFKVSHPAVYVGSLVLLGCLGAAAGTYAAAFPAVNMPRRAKHALVNTWAAQAALCLLYALGIYQTEDERLCRALGLLLHYLSLCVLAWLCVQAHGTYRAAARRRRPRVDAGDPAPRPVLPLYLAGWGLALIVCGISGAVNLREYAGYAQCFPGAAPALAALLAPGAALLLALAALLVLARCALRNPRAPLSEGTERVDLELWEPGRASPARSERSADSEAEDAEHAPPVQLRAQAIVLALHAAAWGAGAAAVYRPLPAYLPYQEDICSILYAVCATVLGTFTLFFYGIARSDVRAQWALVRCRLRPRSVGDCARRSLPAPAPAPASAPSGDNRSHSGSRSSGRTKTNSSAGYKAGAELNGHTLRDKNVNGKSPNINLVVLHRQQYRPDAAPPAAAGAGADAFYNPNQMNVAKKFFKRQRQHSRRCLELPRRDLDADSYGVAALLGGGAKVNNTNLHVRAAEPRRSNNPNLLDEERDHKSYSSDRAVANIYTNVPETRVPQHHVVPVPAPVLAAPPADTRTVSQQCSLEYSSASEPAPRSASEHTLDTSEGTEPNNEPSAAAETTDSDSFGQYVDCRRADREREPDKSLRDISEECTASDDAPPDDRSELDELLRDPSASADACSTNASEHDSDIYCPNYQVSEVSIRSHGLYAPSPSSMCAPSRAASSEDVPLESQYANLPAPASAPAPASSCSDLDELYSLITARRGAPPPAPPSDTLDATAHSDVTLRPDSDSLSDADSGAHTGTLKGTLV